MNERLVDVKIGERVLHTFPISISDSFADTSDEAFKKKALEAAAHAQLVANNELESLSATMHVGRRGPLEPEPDCLGVMAETKSGLEELVRERAYFLWDAAGRPEGRSDEFWHQAQHECWRQRAHALWERAGCPTDHADEHWSRIRDFEQT